ncbi:MAG: hypothetical protein M3024_00405 [Candidatus Dormibacteraeota bacterium]|nr:hypothetical protein [Candidatus Dormibacteraeota bacterium]
MGEAPVRPGAPRATEGPHLRGGGWARLVDGPGLTRALASAGRCFMIAFDIDWELMEEVPPDATE